MRFFVLFAVCVAFVGGIAVWDYENPLRGVIVLRGQHISVNIADTAKEQALGLSGRDSMKENEGMLFAWESPRVPLFWMKDMNFPLDILWISEDKIIVGIERNTLPSSFPQTFSSNQPIRYVLELNAGWTEKYAVVAGDTVEW